jgi:hypothetical protein
MVYFDVETSSVHHVFPFEPVRRVVWFISHVPFHAAILVWCARASRVDTACSRRPAGHGRR